MQRVVVSKESIEVVSVPIPQAGPGEVLVRSVIAGIYGSDTHATQGRHRFIRLPYQPGHEVVGVVEELGADVESMSPWQRVTVEPDLPCWAARSAAPAETYVREPALLRLRHDQGGLADYFTVAAQEPTGTRRSTEHRVTWLPRPTGARVRCDCRTAKRKPGGVAQHQYRHRLPVDAVLDGSKREEVAGAPVIAGPVQS
jgi:threonine dehydrogenase-like Zn-dependent dehydrogenase